jgi:S-adenosylmethionine-diacylglycerol 3-amino-3-carboxypropyl transferase
MANFYSRLSYSFGNEDWLTEHKALQIQPTDSVLCVTASGDRPLNLLTKELKALVAVDANPLPPLYGLYGSGPF